MYWCLTVRMGSMELAITVVTLVCLAYTHGWKDEPLNANDLIQYKDCGAVRKYGGYSESGVYQIWMNSTNSFKIWCIHEANNSFNVIQKRIDGKLSFNQYWAAYKNGFGHTGGDYWLGLNQIYYLTSTGNNVLTVNLQDWAGNNKNERYNYFKLMDSTYYTLNIAAPSGDAGDSMMHNNNMRFATPDRPDHNQCAPHYQGGWWFNYCTYAYLNGKYYIGGPYTPGGPYYDGIYWYSWGGFGYSMKFAQMMLSSS